MILKTFLLAVVLSLSTFSFAQFQLKKGINYSQPLQIDTSDYFIIPKRIDKSNKLKYSTGFDLSNINCTDIFIYNKKTKTSKNIFQNKFCLFYSFMNYSSVNADLNIQYLRELKYSAILKSHILFLVKTNDFNQDGILDEEDPTYLFMSNKTGDSLTQITPDTYDVISWTPSSDFKTLLVKLRKDKNEDKKFSDEDEFFFQIDINQDLTKIKSSIIQL